MRLIFSGSHHLNTNLVDEQGNVLYNVSTPSGPFSKRVTAIHKYSRDGQGEVGAIEWPGVIGRVSFRFDGKVVSAKDMFETRLWSSEYPFVGPDQHKYKWKAQPRCLVKPAESEVELVRFHKKKMGVFKSTLPDRLDIDPSVVSMLDFVILTFAYVETMVQQVESAAASGGHCCCC